MGHLSLTNISYYFCFEKTLYIPAYFYPSAKGLTAAEDQIITASVLRELVLDGGLNIIGKSTVEYSLFGNAFMHAIGRPSTLMNNKYNQHQYQPDGDDTRESHACLGSSLNGINIKSY